MANSRKLKSDLEARVSGALISVVPSGSLLLIGLSGGIDSVVLLHLLSKIAPEYSWQLKALHVHHGISQHADAWAEFCMKFCAALSVPCEIKYVDIKPLREMGIEAAARKLRHAALTEQPADFIALAHHRDDQVETLLLQLLRGAGVRGASAMPLLKRGDDTPALLRPLLNIDRSELEAYAREQDLRWVEDDSNADVSYPRNFLRHEILPVLERKFPTYRTTLARSAGHFAEASDLLDELAGQDAQGVMGGERLQVEALRALGHARAKNLLRYFLLCRGAPMPDTARLEEMLRQLCEATEDAQVQIHWQNWQLRSFRGHAHVLPEMLAPQEFSICWQGESELVLPGSHGVLKFERVPNGGLSLHKLQQHVVTVRSRHGGEAIKLDAARPRQTLRNLLQQHDMPPWMRERLPLLYCAEELVCIPGVASAFAYANEALDEPGVLVSWKCLV